MSATESGVSPDVHVSFPESREHASGKPLVLNDSPRPEPGDAQQHTYGRTLSGTG